MQRQPPRSPLFPYTTLFLSNLNALDLTTGAIQLFNSESSVTTPAPITIDGSALGLDEVGAITIQSQVIEPPRSEEHTSELQSRQYLVCRLLLEKKTTRRCAS